jgi:hypothetical protein
MGLKKKNYEIKNLGITLPEAYALVKNISMTRNNGFADIVIQSSRENAIKLAPLETIRVRFKANVEENPVSLAYAKAKEKGVTEIYDEESGEFTTIEQPAIFDGWEDDIKTE